MLPIVFVNKCLIVVLYISLASANSVTLKTENAKVLADAVTLRTTLHNTSTKLAPDSTGLRSDAETTPVAEEETTASSAPTTTAVPVIDNFKTLGPKAHCKMQLNGYDCKDKGTSLRYYWDVKFRGCKESEGGLCTNNFNNFANQKACRETCEDVGVQEFTTRVTPRIYCTFQPDFGHCNDYYPKFYFDVTHRECRGFSYSGCGGNLNRFATFQVCSAICMPLVEYKLDEGKLV